MVMPEDEINYQTIGHRIKQLRRMQGKRQEDIVSETGISISHYSNIENGHTKLSLNVLVKITQALNVTVDQILFDTIPLNTNSRIQMLERSLGNCSDAELAAFLELWNVFQKLHADLM